MKISQRTLTILKNFSTINNGIYVRKGNVLSTMSLQKNILSEVQVEEKFSKDFAIYELNKFLGVISLFKDPDFEFGEKGVKISEGKNSVNYWYTDPSMVVYPEKKVPFPKDPVISFVLSTEDLQSVLKSAGVMDLPNVSVVSSEGTISIVVSDISNDSRSDYAIDTGISSDEEFKFVFKVELLKLLPGQYDVSFSEKPAVGHFVREDGQEYFIAMEDV